MVPAAGLHVRGNPPADGDVLRRLLPPADSQVVYVHMGAGRNIGESDPDDLPVLADRFAPGDVTQSDLVSGDNILSGRPGTAGKFDRRATRDICQEQTDVVQAGSWYQRPDRAGFRLS
jgi:hypothetical protein